MSKDVPVGYKLTEVGVIPEDWEILSLQEVCKETITYGIVQCGPHIKNGIPYIRVSDMGGSELDIEQMLRTSPSIAIRFSRSTVQEGDLVYALRGKLGEVRQVRRELAGANLTQGTARLSPKEQIDSNYFLWAMRDSRPVKQAEIESKGTTFREITLADLRRIRIPIPLFPEQRSIALVLSDTDALITSLDKLIAKKRDIKQAAMQQLLTGKQRLEGFGDSSGKFQQTEIGLIPEDWEVMSLCDLTTDIGDGIHSTPQYVKISKFYFINGNNLLNGKISITDNTMCVSEDEYLRLKKRLNNQTILLSINGTIGNLAFFDDEDIVLGKSAAYININPLINKDYVFYSLMTIATSRYFESELTGTTIRNLSLATLRNTPIPLPKCEKEQQAIAKVLSDMDSEISALEKRRDKTKSLKQAMMQELLTGKTRLK